MGAGLARDACTAVYQVHRSDAIAGKPAPTQASSHIFDRVYSFTDERPGFFVCNKCENTACKSSDALSSSRLSLLSM